VARLPGVAIFFLISKKQTPHAFELFLGHIHGLPNQVIFLKIKTSTTPIVQDKDRLRVKKFGHQINLITLFLGYAEHKLNITDVLMHQLEKAIPGIDASMTFYLLTEKIKMRKTNWLTEWYTWLWRWPLLIYEVEKSLFSVSLASVRVPMENRILIGVCAEI